MKLIKRIGILFLIVDFIFINAFSTVVYANEEESKQEISSSAIIDATGKEVSQEQARMALHFLHSLESTTNYVIYANNFIAGTNHTEGNVCVNTLTGGGQEWSDWRNEQLYIKTDNLASNNNRASYIGNSDIEMWVDNSDATLYTRDISMVSVNNKGNAIETDEEYYITDTLNNIAQYQFDNNISSIQDVVDLFKNNTISKDNIIILNVNSSDLNQPNEWENKYINQLIDVNREYKATIIINVIPDGDVNISSGMQQYQSDEANGYLIWNFGNYSGTITFECVGVFSGVIIAPNATVITKGVMEGRIVAETYQNTGSEIHQPYDYDKEYPDEPEEPEPEEPDEPKPEEPEEPDTPPDVPPEEPPEEPDIPPDEPPVEPETPPETPPDEPDVPPETPPEEPDTPPDEPDLPPETPPDEPPIIPEIPEIPTLPTPPVRPTPPRPTPRVEPSPAPEPEPVIVTIPDEPIPLSDVLGVREDTGRRLGGVLQNVLGVRVKPKDSDVLGQRRGPVTGDNFDTLVKVLLLCIFIIITILAVHYISKEDKKFKDRIEEYEKNHN